MQNSLKRKLADDTLTFCLGVNQARTPNIVMIAAAAGFDTIYVDLEHNPTSLETETRVLGAEPPRGMLIETTKPPVRFVSGRAWSRLPAINRRLGDTNPLEGGVASMSVVQALTEILRAIKNRPP
jgi:hypothetical protein